MPGKTWIKPALTLPALLALAWLLPAAPVDPWNLLSLKKLVTMIFALSLIQVLGSALVQLLGVKRGVILAGFLGGLISSTATTAAIARASKASAHKDTSSGMLIFLSATSAMLFEIAALLVTGTNDVHYSILLVLAGPLVVTLDAVVFRSRKLADGHLDFESKPFEILPILKLSALILGIITTSKLLQNTFGQSGLFVLTFLVSLFEVHGSVIANIQLHDSGAFDVVQLGSLLAVSVLASFLSKVFLIFTLGSAQFRKSAARSSALLLGSLLVSWLVFAIVTRASS